eukprot:scaffold15669_cov160-Amphora_coffeaeformis.AAC.5
MPHHRPTHSRIWKYTKNTLKIYWPLRKQHHRYVCSTRPTGSSSRGYEKKLLRVQRMSFAFWHREKVAVKWEPRPLTNTVVDRMSLSVCGSKDGRQMMHRRQHHPRRVNPVHRPHSVWSIWRGQNRCDSRGAQNAVKKDTISINLS